MKTLKPNFKTYPQTNRLFALNKIAIERCKHDFPDCYHFKKVLAEECTELADRLKMGLVLLTELKANGTTLTSGQNTQFKAFRNGTKYLIRRLYTLLTWIRANLSQHLINRLNNRTKQQVKVDKMMKHHTQTNKEKVMLEVALNENGTSELECTFKHFIVSPRTYISQFEIRTETLTEKQESFCIAYLECGNILKAYQSVNTGTMKLHSMRARASEMMNDYRVFNELKQLIKARKAKGERLPKFRKGSLVAEWLEGTID